ncbi:MAG: zinc-ribbon domain-containing protein [Candidatus Korobacteraceae bacterium]
MAFCVSCGTQMADNAAFCPNCGKAASQVSGTGASAPPPTPVPPASYGNTNAPAAPMAENIAGMLAYFTIIPAIVFLVIEPYNRNRFVRFHSFQCLFTCAALIVLHICLSIFSYILPLMMFPIWGLLGLAELALWLLLVIKAYQHEMFKLPIVGDLAEKQANA